MSQRLAERIGGIVLCGGKSSRMGRPKAWLPFGSEPMLTRIVGILRESVQPIVVVAAGGQELPPLPASIPIVRDERPDQGPLEGLRVGLAAIGSAAEAVFVTSCDVPLLRPAFIQYLIASLRPTDQIVVPCDAQYQHPLAALYRPTVLPTIESLLAANLRRPMFLFERVVTRFVPVDDLRAVDPDLDSLRNLNHPEDYQAALERAGLGPTPQ